MRNLIALICDAHPAAGPHGPFITMVEGQWAYCPAGRIERRTHHWRPIEPVSVEVLRARGIASTHAPHAATAGE